MAQQRTFMYRSRPSDQPDLFSARLIGRIEGCTNPESAELLDDGETIVFGNCALTVGHPAYRDGKGIVYLAGEAFISRARIVGHGGVELDRRRLISGLTGTLGCDILRRGTARFPAGTVFMNEGGNPVSSADRKSLVPSERNAPRIVAFDPIRGELLGSLPLGPGSPIARKFNGIDQPNGLGIAPNGDLYVGDIPNGNPVAQLPAPVPSAVYRIPYGALDALAANEPAAAEAVQRIPMPGWVNGITLSKTDDSCWAVSCSQHDPVGGGIYRLDPEDFIQGIQPDPVIAGLGILDGIGITRRGTILASTPVSGEVHAFTSEGEHKLIRLEDDEKIVRMPADFNVCYPLVLNGEPALLVTDISVGRQPGDGSVAVVDISGL
jgi:hypothetical protein